MNVAAIIDDLLKISELNIGEPYYGYGNTYGSVEGFRRGIQIWDWTYKNIPRLDFKVEYPLAKKQREIFIVELFAYLHDNNYKVDDVKVEKINRELTFSATQ